MSERWKDFISSWGTLPVGGNLGLPAAPTQPGDELWRPLWPTTVGEASWVPMPVSSTPPQGGLFSSLSAGASDGILGQLAPPPEYLNSSRYWGATPAPSRTSTSPTRVGDYYLSPALPAPDWNAIASRASMRAAQPFLESPSRSSWMVPADNPEAASSANSSGGEAQGISQVLSDATSDDHWILGADYAGGGHHQNPRAVYRKFPLPEETRKVFDKATTGPLPFFGWHQYDDLHRLYNNAVEELMNRFMKEHSIQPEQMTPDHARGVLRAIAESEDLRIRAYRAMLQHMGRLYRLRSGTRGSE